MRVSTDRILTTHVGSLPRPQEVVDAPFAQDRGEALDPQAFDAIMRAAVADVVQKQVDAGVDELVAERLCRYADIVGRKRMIAGTDCGFGTFAGAGAVYPPIAYAKLSAMAEGAAIATRRLRGR